ncbi:oligosaccharide flippase family protein [bacterium]|nr:oligosaccharide flippase family protein [bacterium]
MRIIKDTFFMLISNLAIVILSIIQYPILLRIYDFPPEIFGIFQYIFSVVLTITAFSYLSLHNAIVAEREEHSPHQREQFLSWFLIITNAIGFLSLIIFAIIKKSSSSFIISALSIYISSSFFNAYYALARDKKFFGRISIATVAQSFFKIILTIAAGYFIRNEIALVCGMVVANFASAYYIYRKVKVRPSFLEFQYIKKFLQDNRQIVIFQTLSNLLNTFSYNLPVFLIEKYFGNYALGLYSLAYRTLLMANRIFSQVATQTFLPYMSKSPDDEKTILEKYHYLALLLFPIYFAIGSFARYYVPFIFGVKNAGIIPIIKIIVPWMFAVAVCNPATSAYFVHRKNFELLVVNILLLAARLLSFILFADEGLHLALKIFSAASAFFFTIIFVRSYTFAKVKYIKALTIIASMEVILFASMLWEEFMPVGYAAMVISLYLAIRIGIKVIRKNGLRIFNPSSKSVDME